MAKANIKAKLIDKGEKYALFGAGGLMLLFCVFGIMKLSATPNVDSFVQEVEGNANKVTNTINGSVGDSVKSLPAEIHTSSRIEAVKSHWAHNLFFDPIMPPDKRAINPVVLPIKEIQGAFLNAKIIAYDFRETADGETLIGVLANALAKDKDKIDPTQVNQSIRDLRARMRPMPPGFNPMGNMPRPMPPLRPGREGMPPRPGNPANLEGGERFEVDYVLLDPEKLKDKRFALTILPRRMVVIQASFPYKAQIEEIQKALRLESPNDVFTVYPNEETPLFRGVLVQRQILFPDGAVDVPWADVDVETQYRGTILRRKYQDKPEDPNSFYVMLHKGHKLVFPLPLLLTGKYPPIRLESINESIKKMVALNKPPEPKKAPNQFKGDGDPFEPVGGSAVGANGQPNAAGLLVPMFPVGREMDKGLDGPLNESNRFQESPDHILIRLIDDEIEPGRLYQYRMKMLMQNPNWWGPKDKKGVPLYKEKRDRVSRPSDAEVMLLGADISDEAVIKQRFDMPDDEVKKNLAARTDWTEMGEKISVPREEYMFGCDPPPTAPNTRPLLKSGQGMLQFQRWLPFANIDKYKEPVADWVVAEIVAPRGPDLGGKQLVNLPLWSSNVNKYVLRIGDAEKGKAHPRRGVLIDPTKPGPQFIVADVEGGTIRSRPATRVMTIDEETAAEVLLIDESGSLQVRGGLADRADLGRADREKAWKDWIDKTEKDPQSLPGDATNPKKKDGFD